MMKMNVLANKIASLNFRQVVYILIGIYLLVSGILQKDLAIAAVSLLFLYQGVFNTCALGSCAVTKRNRTTKQ